jgi:WhiB family transcriptional regulator, redox-sensing transcriptional regulator
VPDVTALPFPALPDDREADWRDRALCAEVGTDFFFPEKRDSARPAKAVCAACEVREPCLEFALEHAEQWGIYGGLSVGERRALQRQRRKEAA